MSTSGAATPPTFNYTVADNNPVWFFCATGAHCKSGMVFAVNPTANETFAAFQAAAKGNSGSSNDNSGSGYGYGGGGSGGGGGGVNGRASIGFGAVAGALTLGVLAAI
jgi:uncharacterized membrane protein YgcG